MQASVRSARLTDLPSLGRMGASLAHLHHDLDSKRFMLPEEVEAGYRWWFERELRNDDAVILVAEQNGQLTGYAYGSLQERNWNALLDACGGFHDLWVDPAHRKGSVGAKLAEEMVTKLRALGAPRIVLSTAAKNEAAQRFFAKLGWRPTMVEMTREA